MPCPRRPIALTYSLTLTLALNPLHAQNPTTDHEGVRQAILDYVEGIYEQTPERIRRSVHPTLAKRGYQVPRDSTRYHEYPMTFDQLVNVARTFNQTRWIKPDAPKRIEIFDVLDQTATAKLTAVWGIDYFHLAKFDGKWMIVNVMWQAPPEAHPLFRKASGPADDLSSLSDEFDNAARRGEWTQHHEVEGWSNKLRRSEIGASGTLVLEPHTSIWYFDYTGPFQYKEIEGDFMVTTRLRVTGTSADYPQSVFSMAGLMVRRPRPDVPFTSDDKWPKDRENYIFVITGTTDSAGVAILETKSAVRSSPLVKHYPLAQKGWLELRIVRLSRSLIVLYRPDGGDWIVHERFYRPDLPAKVQVGMVASSDFTTIEQKHWYRPWEYNRNVIADGKADLRAEFDWVRFQRVAAPAEAESWLRSQRITWDNHRITNDHLTTLLPFLTARSNGSVQQNEPERVQPGVISTDRNETFPSVDPVDGSLWYSVFTDNFDRQTILRAPRSGAGWGAPAAVSFSTGQSGDRAPRFSPDTRRLYFSSNRPTPSNPRGSDFNLWLIERRAGG
ncbi:MAG: nuclear transport factor 2 family protein, partial [Longimicrobiales bacterium]